MSSRHSRASRRRSSSRARPDDRVPRRNHLIRRGCLKASEAFMRADEDRKALDKELKRWEETTLREALKSLPERRAEFLTTSSRPVKRLYTPLDLAGKTDEDRLGKPGEFPFTRGPHPTMYRGKPWTMRMFSGFGSPEDTNRRFRYLLAHGQTGLSTAFDLPTLMGRDADDPWSEGEVGICGVAISSLKDMETLFAGIPLDKV